MFPRTRGGVTVRPHPGDRRLRTLISTSPRTTVYRYLLYQQQVLSGNKCRPEYIPRWRGPFWYPTEHIPPGQDVFTKYPTGTYTLPVALCQSDDIQTQAEDVNRLCTALTEPSTNYLVCKDRIYQRSQKLIFLSTSGHALSWISSAHCVPRVCVLASNTSHSIHTDMTILSQMYVTLCR